MEQHQIDAAIKAFQKSLLLDGKSALTYTGKQNILESNALKAIGFGYGPDNFKNIAVQAGMKLANQDYSGMENAAKTVFGITPDDTSYKTACLSLLAAEIELYKARAALSQGDTSAYNALLHKIQNSDGNLSATALTNSMPAPPSLLPTRKFSQVIEEYTKHKIKSKKWNEKSVYENKSIFDVLLYVVEDIDMRRFDDADFAQEIKERLQRLPLNKSKFERFNDMTIHQVIKLNNVNVISDARVNRYLEFISSLVKFSIKRRWMEINHVEDIKIPIKTDESEERDAYNKNDIEMLLNGLQGCFRKGEPEKLWISTIMLFHGCRPADLVRLTKDKFRVVDDILCVDLKSKTDAGCRTVPVHPDLLECGFLRFLDSIPDGANLWSNKLKFNKKDQDSHERWYNRAFEPKYVTDAPKKSLYSIRHSFITDLKHKFVDRLVLKEIVGHEKGLPGNDITNDRYGKPFPPSTKLEVMRQLDYGVDLTKFKEFCNAIKW